MELAGLREVDDIAGTYGKLNYGDFEFVKVTQQVWDKMTELQQANAVLSAIDDTDEAESYIGADWSDLPSVATANMRIAVKKGTSMNEAFDRNKTIKLEVAIIVGDLIDLFSGEEDLDPSVMTDPAKFSKFTRLAAADLGEWLVEPNPQTGVMGGREWASDGIDSGTYDDFLASDGDDL
jgi:hypothetical protein